MARLVSSHTGKGARGHLGLKGYTGADGPYSQDRSYDQFGNATHRLGWGGSQGSGFDYNYSFTNNRLVQDPATSAYLQYDAAGNLKNDGYQTASYDATGQQTYQSGTALTQAYDGDRLRGKKTENGVTTYYLRSSVLGGQVVAELNSSGGWTRGFVYLGGQMVAIQGGTGGAVSWVHQDPVTKSQRITNSGGAVTSTVDLDPWGGETWRSSNAAFQPHEFTSYERDANGGDDAMNRRYQANWNRFSQPDPYDGSYDLANPQSFNRYAYTQNDPVNFVDPSGLLNWTPDIGNAGEVTVVGAPEGVSGGLMELMLGSLFARAGSGGGGRGVGGDLGVGGGGGGGNPQNPTTPQQKPKQKCTQDKTGGDRGDILELLGRAGVSGDISNIRSAGPKNPEGILFNIGNRQPFVDTLNADKRFRHGTPFGSEHTGQVGGNLSNTLDYRSFTTPDGLGADSTGHRRSLQIDVGPRNPAGGASGYADLDCDNPAQDVNSTLSHGLPIIFRRLAGLFGR